MPPSLTGTVLKKKWRLGALVGKGGCAEVYEAFDAQAQISGNTAGSFVAKIAPVPVGLPPAIHKGKKRKKTEQEKHADMIYYEHTLYKGYLRDHGGVVEIPAGGYGEDQNLRYLVMSRLGPDVEASQKKSKGWSVARKAGYARQMLALLHDLHDKCKMVFVDVKPENFMFGLPGSADEDKIFLIDFGLSTRYTGPAGTIKPQGQSAQVQGTPEFLSLKCHAGASAGRCDDLESLGYVIVSMLKNGSTALPWSGSTSVAGGLATKTSTTLEALCRGCPAGMLKYMTAVRDMKYEETPDYDKLDAMLKSMQSDGAAAGGARGGSSSAKNSAKTKPEAAASAAASIRGTSSAKSRTTSAAKRGARGKPAAILVSSEEEHQEQEVEVCEVSVKGKGRQRASTEEAAENVPPAPASPKQRTTTAVRRSRRLSSPTDGEEFFDALQEHEGNKGEEEELEVTKVVQGATKRAGRSAPTAGRAATAAAAAGKKGPSSTATASAMGKKQKGVFLLEVLAGPHKGETLQLSAGGAEVRVGRNAPRKNGLRLDKDFEVSDKHAILRPRSDGISVEDANSLNGSFVNEDRLEGTLVLRGGDVLQVGQSVVKIT